jgi:hypothetical protein
MQNHSQLRLRPSYRPTSCLHFDRPFSTAICLVFDGITARHPGDAGDRSLDITRGIPIIIPLTKTGDMPPVRAAPYQRPYRPKTEKEELQTCLWSTPKRAHAVVPGCPTHQKVNNWVPTAVLNSCALPEGDKIILIISHSCASAAGHATRAIRRREPRLMSIVISRSAWLKRPRFHSPHSMLPADVANRFRLVLINCVRPFFSTLG